MERIDVLDKGFVELQAVMGDDLAIVNAARTSYLGESKGDDKDKKLLFYLMQHRHDGPFEFVEFRFRIKAPEMVWRQLLRHRTGSYNLQSYRYTEAQEDEFYIPTEWRLQSATNKQGSEGRADRNHEAVLIQVMESAIVSGYNNYKLALNYGIAREQARLFLPAFALYSVGVVKFDARNLMHLLSLRMAEEAQWETRQYAAAMWQFFEQALPWTAEAYQLYREGGR